MEVYVVHISSLDTETPIAVCGSLEAVSTLTEVDEKVVKGTYEENKRHKAFLVPRGRMDFYVVRIFNIIK